MVEYKIQNIVFPTEVKHQRCKKLFYRGENGNLDRKEKTLYLGAGQNVDFVTYINACSYNKWRTYTGAKNAVLYLEVEGEFSFCAVGYTKDVLAIERTEFANLEYKLDNRQLIRFEFPDNNEQMIGFEISVKTHCVIYGGYYTVQVEEDEINNICLSVATTTCKKEAFIKKNVELLKKEILESNEEIKENLYIHVTDNGRTLSDKDINGNHVFLHPNNNTGGSGGFARGMMEALNQTPKATHVLLMDDDVLMLPESIVRTFNLLRLIKKEYQDCFISGAMLYYEEPNKQHEDIGRVSHEGYFRPLKPVFDQELLECNLENEAKFIRQKNEYAAWWYCCIPVQVIEKNGLPLPFFIRGDDIEYALRCKARIITLNAICVWHLGFVTKNNAAFNHYQTWRNLLIGQACTGILPGVNLFKSAFKAYRVEILRFNYDSAELVLKALEDFVKGPEFIKQDNGEKIVKANYKLNDHLVPLEELEDIDIDDVFSCVHDPERKFLDKWLLRITYNGHRFWPTKWCKKDYAYITFEHRHQPQKIAMHRKLVTVNPFDRTGQLRELDKKRFKSLQCRLKNVMKYYRNNREELENNYKNAADYLTSEVFWKEYLGIKGN